MKLVKLKLYDTVQDVHQLIFHTSERFVQELMLTRHRQQESSFYPDSEAREYRKAWTHRAAGVDFEGAGVVRLSPCQVLGCIGWPTRMIRPRLTAVAEAKL